MPNRDAGVERRERRCQDCGRVTLYKHPVGIRLGEYVPHAVQDSSRNVGEVLSGSHDVKIVIRLEVKQPKNRIEHLPMLRRDAELVLYAVGG